jgi:hypothetical protein
MTDRVARDAFRRAHGDAEPDVSHIAEAIPEMMVEARRRRERAERAGEFARLVPLARRALPRLAAAAAILVVSATLVGIRDASETGNGSAGLDRMMLTGDVNVESSDILLEAIVQGGRDDG